MKLSSLRYSSRRPLHSGGLQIPGIACSCKEPHVFSSLSLFHFATLSSHTINLPFCVIVLAIVLHPRNKSRAPTLEQSSIANEPRFSLGYTIKDKANLVKCFLDSLLLLHSLFGHQNSIDGNSNIKETHHGYHTIRSCQPPATNDFVNE
jgi:hypothetical protein